MQGGKTGANESSIEDEFIPNDLNSLLFNDKPVIVSKNTAMFYFKDFEDKEIWLLIEKERNYKYQWLCDGKKISRKLSDSKGLHISKKTRDENLINDLTSKIEIPGAEIKAFFNDLGLFLEENEYKILFIDIPEDPHNEILHDRPVYNSFEDYPEHIQQEALQIVQDAPLKFFEDVLYYIHKGDTKAKNLVLLSIGSLFVKNAKPVHQGFKGTTGVGKTSITNKTAAIVPNRYIQKIRDTSPKYIYYAANSFNPEHNIFLFDDVVLSDIIIELLKTLTDNETKNKVLKTVIEQKAQELGIPGDALVLCTVAQDILNTELDRRLMYNNPKEDEDHTKGTKEIIKQNNKTDIDLDNEIIQELYLRANAVFELLIKNPVKVYNPYIDEMDLENKNYTDIAHFINLVKARSFYNQHNRYKINDVIIGSWEDFQDVEELWESISTLQEYKISAKQKELLKMLKMYDPGVHQTLKESWEMDKTDFNESKNYTYKYFAKKLGMSSEALKKWVKGVKYSDKPGLEDLGLVIAKQLDPEIRTSPYILYFNPEKPQVYKDLHSEDDKTLEIPGNVENPIQQLTKTRGFKGFISKEDKRSIIIEFLMLTTKYNIKGKNKKIDDYIKKHPEPLKTDKDIYEFINGALEFLNIDSEMKDDISKLSSEDLIKNISLLYGNSVVSDQGQQDKDLQGKQGKNNIGTAYNSKKLEGKKVKEDLTSGIPGDVLNAAYEILKFNEKGIIKHGFRADLLEALKEDNENIVFDYEQALIEQNYILFNKRDSLIAPTNKLISLFQG